ncbi:MAG: hypothetical protein K2N36_09240 [Ruminiclostridium sp.]|nr:hypothetical protein [Ruminiclostridium sp.]
MPSSEMMFGGIGIDPVPVGGLADTVLSQNGSLAVSDDRLPGAVTAVNGNKRVSSSLFLNVYREGELRDLSYHLSGVMDHDGSLGREGFYSNNAGFVGRCFDFSEVCELGDRWESRKNGLFGEVGGKAFVLSINGGNAFYAAGAFGFCRGEGKDRRVDFGGGFECGCDHEREIGGHYGVPCRFADGGFRCETELCFAERDRCYSNKFDFAERDRCYGNEFDLAERDHRCGNEFGFAGRDCCCKVELGFVGFDCGLNAGDSFGEKGFFADNIFLLNGRADRIGKQALQNDDRSFGNIGLVLKSGKENFDTGFYGAACGADLLSAPEVERIVMEKGRLPLPEELVISPEEVRRIRRAIVTEYCAEPVKAEIRVDMSGMKNIINRETDIDSIVTDLTAAVSEAVASAAEGVHGL